MSADTPPLRPDDWIVLQMQAPEQLAIGQRVGEPAMETLQWALPSSRLVTKESIERIVARLGMLDFCVPLADCGGIGIRLRYPKQDHNEGANALILAALKAVSGFCDHPQWILGPWAPLTGQDFWEQLPHLIEQRALDLFAAPSAAGERRARL